LIRLVEEMVYREQIAGPWGSTTGSPLGARLCWSVPRATLVGDRIHARLAMPGADWIRIGADGLRRQDQRLTFVTDDDAVVLLSYDNGLIKPSERFTAALATGGSTSPEDQYMRMVAQLDTGDERYSWLTEHLFLGEGRVAGNHEIEYTIYRVD
jgi:hypothetical protein